MSHSNPNEILINEDCCEMTLYNKNKEPVAKTIFNKQHLSKVLKYRWYRNHQGYVVATTNKRLRLHHIALERKPGLLVDHIDENKLNNLDNNLRYCTQSTNMMNRKKSRGYYWNKGKNRWTAEIKINYKKIHLGHFKTEQEAINARRQAELKYFGEFAPKRH